MSSQYRSGTAHPDSPHIVHEVRIQNLQGEMQCIRALFECGARSIFRSPKLRKQLGLRDEAAVITTLGLDGRVMESAGDSRKVVMMVQYLEHLATVDESDVLVVPMQAYGPVLGLSWFSTRKPNIDWTC
jgi:hypothetical protein